MSDHDAVWAETTHGGLLRQLFGYYPTFHDARLREIVVEAATRNVEMVVDYSDRVEDQDTDKELAVRIRLKWEDVEEMNLDCGESYLMGFEITHFQGKMKGTFELGFGTYGTIISRGFEAILEKVDPPEFDSDHPDRIALRFR